MSNGQIPTPVPGRLASLVYNTLVRVPAGLSRDYTAPWWQKAWHRSRLRFRNPVRSVVHGRPMLLNFDYIYPVCVRQFPHFNSPLVELVHLVHQSKGAPITHIDIGAAIGDTVLLVDANCPGMVGHYVCLDADAELFGFLRSNLGHLPSVTYRMAVLAASEDEVADELYRSSYSGSVKIGRDVGPPITLDRVLQEEGIGKVDVLKIDVDGYDGRILKGASGTLQKSRPAVIFEWHPPACEQVGNSWTEHFEVLLASGYRDFVWFTKFGTFSHIMRGYEADSIAAMAALCLDKQLTSFHDWHFDVVALPDGHGLSLSKLADLSYARNRPSPH